MWQFLSAGGPVMILLVLTSIVSVAFIIERGPGVTSGPNEEKLGVRGTFREVMNRALNQTFSRTIITSGTVFLSTMALFIWGGGALNDFSFTFLVGIITGTYSSIYIASALVLWWNKGERPKMAESTTAVAPDTQVNPSKARA